MQLLLGYIGIFNAILLLPVSFGQRELWAMCSQTFCWCMQLFSQAPHWLVIVGILVNGQELSSHQPCSDLGHYNGHYGVLHPNDYHPNDYHPNDYHPDVPTTFAGMAGIMTPTILIVTVGIVCIFLSMLEKRRFGPQYKCRGTWILQSPAWQRN